jgi:Xaa-Pro aminopeptidase
MTDLSFVPNPPTLSLAERDRRWAVIRDMMRRNDIECLLIPAAPHRYPSDLYFTNDIPGCSVVFPLNSEPVAMHRGASVAGSWQQARDWGESTWIQDMRFGARGSIMLEVLKERGLTSSRIGTIGVLGGPNLIPVGWAPHPFWTSITQALPDARFVELWDEFAAIWLTKSDEEVALYRYASQVSEQVCQVMLDVTRAGVSESAIYAAMMHEYHRNGASPAHDLFVHSGTENLSWDAPRWLYRAQKPRVVQDGDVVLSEIMLVVGGIEAQAQMCIGIGNVAEPFRRAATVARESYEAGIRTIRAGVTFGEVAEAMQEPLRRAGAWHLTPHIHSVTPLTLVSPVTEGLDPSVKDMFRRVDQLPGTGLDVVLETGMTLAFEPNAAFGRQQVNIGGNVLVTEDGCEELNVLSNHMHFVK